MHALRGQLFQFWSTSPSVEAITQRIKQMEWENSCGKQLQGCTKGIKTFSSGRTCGKPNQKQNASVLIFSRYVTYICSLWWGYSILAQLWSYQAISSRPCRNHQGPSPHGVLATLSAVTTFRYCCCCRGRGCCCSCRSPNPQTLNFPWATKVNNEKAAKFTSIVVESPTGRQLIHNWSCCLASGDWSWATVAPEIRKGCHWPGALMPHSARQQAKPICLVLLSMHYPAQSLWQSMFPKAMKCCRQTSESAQPNPIIPKPKPKPYPSIPKPWTPYIAVSCTSRRNVFWSFSKQQ